MNSRILANHTLSFDRRLDCLPQFDERSRAFLVRDLLSNEDPITSKEWPLAIQLDQGAEGACVGFGFAHELAAEPVPVEGVSNERARGIYHRAQQLDEWPGTRYEGTSVLAGAKACVESGGITAYFWATSAVEVARAISNIGPVVIGVNWHQGMENTDVDGCIHVTGPVRGGHCVCLHGVDFDGENLSFIGRNSWGSEWGDLGGFRIDITDLQMLVESGGAFCVPTTRAQVGTWPERRRRWWERFQIGREQI
jgi:hypothetical protein